MNKLSVLIEKKYINWAKFVTSSFVFLMINLLLFYFFSSNIYIDLIFVIIVFFAFKLLKLSSLNVFLQSIFYFITVLMFELINDYILSYKIKYLLSFYIKSATFYAMSFFILAFLAYIYEEKLESKINLRKKRLSYLSVLFIFCTCFILLFINLYDCKAVNYLILDFYNYKSIF